MRGAVVGSGIVHVALLVVLLIVRGPAPMIVPGPEVVQVALLDAPQAVPVAPAVQPPPPKAKPLEIKPTDESGVKLEPPKPPRPKPAEKPAPSKPAPAAAPALPSAPVGNSGLVADVRLDAANFEFTYYLMLIRTQVGSHWAPPAGLGTGSPVRTVVVFRIQRDGQVTGVALESSSGREFFDRAALRAVVLSDPLPPLPLGYPGGDLGIHFGFEFTGP